MQCDGAVATTAAILGAAVLVSIAALTADIHASSSADLREGSGQGYGNVAMLPRDKTAVGSTTRFC